MITALPARKRRLVLRCKMGSCGHADAPPTPPMAPHVAWRAIAGPRKAPSARQRVFGRAVRFSCWGGGWKVRTGHHNKSPSTPTQCVYVVDGGRGVCRQKAWTLSTVGRMCGCGLLSRSDAARLPAGSEQESLGRDPSNQICRLWRSSRPLLWNGRARRSPARWRAPPRICARASEFGVDSCTSNSRRDRTPKKGTEPGRARTCNLLVRSQTRCLK